MGGIWGGDPGLFEPFCWGVGTKFILKGNGLVAAGVYTLLPARYALLPGAFLVTPTAGAPHGLFHQAGRPGADHGLPLQQPEPGGDQPRVRIL